MDNKANGTGNELGHTNVIVEDNSNINVNNFPLEVSNDLQSYGAEQSAKVSGNPQVLSTHFEWFFQDAMRKANGKSIEQQKKIDDLRKEITGLESNNEKLKNDIKSFEEKIDEFDEEIKNIRHKEHQEITEKKEEINKRQIEIDKIKNGDYSVLGTEVKPGDRIGYFIGVGILSFLTIYLVIFYTSVIFSAFILDPLKAAIDMAAKGGIFSITVVNLQAIPNTYVEHGFLGVAFLLFATFMFIALGYLIHKFNEKKQTRKSVFVYVFTFLFDAVLAYTIVRNIHLAQVSSGTIGNTPWIWHHIFTSMDFYIILMAGFAAYIIWGFILEYMISEYDNIVPARVGIKTREREMAHLNEQITGIKENYTRIIANLLEKINEVKEEKNQTRTKIDNNTTAIEIKQTDISTLEKTVSISVGDLKTRMSQFLIGWCGQIKMTFDRNDSKTLIEKCHDKMDTFYKTIKID